MGTHAPYLWRGIKINLFEFPTIHKWLSITCFETPVEFHDALLDARIEELPILLEHLNLLSCASFLPLRELLARDRLLLQRSRNFLVLGQVGVRAHHPEIVARVEHLRQFCGGLAPLGHPRDRRGKLKIHNVRHVLVLLVFGLALLAVCSLSVLFSQSLGAGALGFGACHVLK
jgi:hypothetical protein